jgi:DNA-binding MarR family transcriptional regulator
MVESETPAAPPADAPTLEQACKSIWTTLDLVLELLRSHSSSQVRAQKAPNVLWLDDLTRAQSNAVVAIKNLCETSPQGVTLTKLAETIGVSPAAASVMVDVLVAKKTVKRTRSKNDRRAIRVRLTPQTAALFEVGNQSLTDAVMSIADTVGEETLFELRRLLLTVLGALRQSLSVTPYEDSETSGTAPGAEDERTADESWPAHGRP